ncbi:MAG: hypothetical protein QOH35_3573 [Acidobacteriaceae bacterium]|jgi:hypothetical protein|nr:hypothetical protein [Acidobacteriaceae bacterium]
MELDTDKIDPAALALLALGRHEGYRIRLVTQHDVISDCRRRTSDVQQQAYSPTPRPARETFCCASCGGRAVGVLGSEHRSEFLRRSRHGRSAACFRC